MVEIKTDIGAVFAVFAGVYILYPGINNPRLKHRVIHKHSHHLSVGEVPSYRLAGVMEGFLRFARPNGFVYIKADYIVHIRFDAFFGGFPTLPDIARGATD